MADEHLIIGGPGAGKTTHLAQLTEELVDKYGEKGVMLCSLTRSAASEIRSRRINIHKSMVGTIHSHCYHALNRPKLAETPEGIEEWNKSVSNDLQIEHGITASYEASKEGTRLITELGLLRAKMVPKDKWPRHIKKFSEKWEDFKKVNDLLDFSDLIEIAIDTCPVAPNNPRVIIVDEGADTSRIEYEMIKRWSRSCERLIIAGDKMQTLYSWRGADPDILDPSRVDDDHLTVLGVSWRVPQNILDFAIKFARKYIQGPEAYVKFRSEKDGGIMAKAHVRDVLDMIEEDLGKEQEPMLLATCGYMLNPFISEMRKRGIPYTNPYVDRWSPLEPANGIGIVDRIKTYMQANPQIHGDYAEFWSVRDLQVIMEPLIKVFKRGVKKKLKEMHPDTPPENIAIFIQDAFRNEGDRDAFLSFNVDWYLDHYKKGESVEFTRNIIKSRGIKWITDEDLLKTRLSCIVGTIHSVKGGAADCVYILPKLSKIGWKQWRKSGFDNKEAVVRTFYVGMTRARKKCVLLEGCKGGLRWGV